MKKLVFFFYITCFIGLNCITANADSSHRVVAIVNNDVITDLDLERRFNLFVKMNKLPQDPEFLKDVKNHVLNALIDEKLILEDAKALKITVTYKELQDVVTAFAEQSNLSKAKFLDILKHEGVDISEFYKNMRGQSLISKIFNIKFAQSIKISSDELLGSRLLYEKLKASAAEQNPLKLKLSEILIYTDEDPKSAERAFRILDEITKQPDASGNFANLANSFSQSSTAKDGGIIGWVSFNDLSSEVQNALRGLKEGQITDPIRMNNAFVIFKVLERRMPQQKKSAPPDQKVIDQEIARFLFQRKIMIQSKDYIDKLRKDAFIEIK